MRRLVYTIAWMLLALPAFADKWALLIGIDDYEDRNHISSLAGAARDARQFQKTLTEVMGVEDSHIQLLVADKNRANDASLPTRANISKALSRLKQNAKQGDTVYVFYSGHGIRVGTKDYLLPYDFQGLDAESGIDTAYEEDKFYERLSQVQAAAIVLVWDKCRNDPFGKTRDGSPQRNNLTSSQAEKGWTIKRDPSAPPLPMLVKLFACSPGQSSYEWLDKGQGYFTYFLERGLRGEAANDKGQITVKSLKDYLIREVTTRVKQNENALQNPNALLEGANPEDLVLAVAGKTVIAKAPEPSKTVKPANTTAPVKKTPPTTNTVTPPDASLPLPQRVLKAHRWETYQKLSSVRYSGSVKLTAPEADPETWSGFTLDTTPDGKFHAKWSSTEMGVQEAGGTVQTLWVKVNGMPVFSPPDEHTRPTVMPQGIFNTLLSALQATPKDWKSVSGESGPALTIAQSEGGINMTLIAVFDTQTYRLKRLKVAVGALGRTTHRFQYDITCYRDVQGVPLPEVIQIEIVNVADNETERAVHTYSRVEANVSLPAGFNEG